MLIENTGNTFDDIITEIIKIWNIKIDNFILKKKTLFLFLDFITYLLFLILFYIMI